MGDEIQTGRDGLARCSWGSTPPELRSYHDDEWGLPVTGDDRLFEHICLEAFQCGLSWLTVLRKREAFRAGFADFRIETVAAFGEKDVARLLADPGIVRNRNKIVASIENARRAIAVIEEVGSLAGLIWRFAPEERPPPRSYADTPPVTAESEALSKELKRRGFRFLGPTTVCALMQACGPINAHLDGCHVRKRVAVAREAALEQLRRD
jgi:DNA-3-methyladenine glycosylase I